MMSMLNTVESWIINVSSLIPVNTPQCH
jgi:hypothetical protein